MGEFLVLLGLRHAGIVSACSILTFAILFARQPASGIKVSGNRAQRNYGYLATQSNGVGLKLTYQSNG